MKLKWRKYKNCPIGNESAVLLPFFVVMKPRNFIGEVESRYLSTLKVSTVSAPITIMFRGANSSYNLVMWWRHKLYSRKCTSSVCSKHFFKAQNDFINDFTALHKHSNLILALQLYIKRSYTTLYPEKISCKSICILDNRNIQITIRGQREKRGGINSIVIEFYVCMYVQKMFWAKVRAIRILVLQKLQNG